MKLEFEVVTEHDFPFGLRCPKCQREIEIGQPYVACLDFMSEQGEELMELHCVYC